MNWRAKNIVLLFVFAFFLQSIYPFYSSSIYFVEVVEAAEENKINANSDKIHHQFFSSQAISIFEFNKDLKIELVNFIFSIFDDFQEIITPPPRFLRLHF